jgi:type II secretory pathway component PulF
MATGEDRGTLVAGLRHASETYHRRAQRAVEAARLLMPVLLSLSIGGTATALYAILVFGSWAAMLRSLTGM